MLLDKKDKTYKRVIGRLKEAFQKRLDEESRYYKTRKKRSFSYIIRLKRQTQTRAQS